MDVLSLLVGLFAGALAVLIVASLMRAARDQRQFDAGRASRADEISQIDAQLAVSQRDALALREQVAALNDALRDVGEARAMLTARLDEQTRAQAEKLRWIDTAREQLAQQFQAIAASVLESKSERFTATNSEQISALMNPLREQLQQFQQLVAESRAQEGESRAVLRTEIVNLRQMSERLSGDASNLTRALTGDSRSQGAWGELVLERLLEASGLVEGREFETQVVLRDEGTEVRRPDVVVRLPGGRDVVIDAKVSLTAFERWSNEHDADLRAQCLVEHLASLRRHVDELGRRGYGRSSGLASNGIVLMFVPIEAAYLEAIRIEPKLYEVALRNDVVIVSPGMLLGVLRTIDHVWKAEARSQNADKIAERAGLLYDKFVAFIQDLQRAAEQVGKARESIDSAIGKLGTGRGHLVGQVEKLRQLGARSGRELRTVLPNSVNGDDEVEDTTT